MPGIIPNFNSPLGDSADYAAALAYLYGRINYEKIGVTPYTLSYYRLDRMRKLLQILANPHQCYDIVHIAGTKGKGTTATLLAAALRACGKRSGLYTSPHLLRLEERIQIDGECCSPSDLVQLTTTVRLAAEQLERQGGGRATFFELTTAMGFLYFAQRGADAVVLEVGLGGRLDSTNVCTPIVSVITSISLDHQAQLGDTLDLIAREKGGIIKPQIPVVSVARAPEARAVIADIAHGLQAPLHLIDRDFHIAWAPKVLASSAAVHAVPLTSPVGSPNNQYCMQETAELSFHTALRTTEGTAAATIPDAPHESLEGSWQTCLLGRHQADNIAAVLATFQVLQQRGWQIPRSAVREAIAHAHPPARLQIVDYSPISIIDSAHNPASVAAGLNALAEHFPARELIIVFAASRDKDWSLMLDLLGGRAHKLILTAYRENPRALPLSELQQRAEQLSERWACAGRVPPCIETVEGPETAWGRARQLATEEQVVYATGSFFLAAEIMIGLTR